MPNFRSSIYAKLGVHSQLGPIRPGDEYEVLGRHGQPDFAPRNGSTTRLSGRL